MEFLLTIDKKIFYLDKKEEQPFQTALPNNTINQIYYIYYELSD